ncbi:MAG: hypothetical protein EP332_09275 [Bacteroidetes bacterium]|nr:MAG: hypothetical protein EP332_09275 [Bacteroidota bacterium]
MKLPIHESMSAKSFILGSVLLVFSLILALNVFAYAIIVLSILLAIIGISVTLGLIRYVLDKTSGQIVKLFYLGPIPIKTARYDLKKAKGIQLAYFSETQVMNHLSQSSTVRTKSYEVNLDLGDEKIMLYESADYPKSLAMLEKIGAYLELPTEDRYAKIREAAMARRRNRD